VKNCATAEDCIAEEHDCASRGADSEQGIAPAGGVLRQEAYLWL